MSVNERFEAINNGQDMSRFGANPKPGGSEAEQINGTSRQSDQKNMRWKLTKLEPEPGMEVLARELGVKQEFPPELANILFQRDIRTFEAAREYFRPAKSHLHSPWLMQDMDKAVARVRQAIQSEEKILIYGDYDVDGTTSVALLTLFFRDWGIETGQYVPDRYEEGYGLSFKGVDYAAQNGFGLMIVLDCGTKALDKVRYAGKKGVDIIICDHHTPGPELPEAVALLNPRRADCAYPFKELSACGLGLKLIQAIDEKLRASGRPVPAERPLDRFADLVALSIAADIVDVQGENRIIAWFGLQKIRSNPLPGIQALMNLSETERPWDFSDLIFFMAPRINAAGRLGSALRAVKMLCGDPAEMAAFADQLNSSNADRKLLDSEITSEALAFIEEENEKSNRVSTVLYKETWHKGVIGIVASRVMEKYYRPTILLTRSNGHWVGSGRSVHDFDLYEALDACSQHIVQFGGHKYAAGLTVREADLESFKAAFEAVVRENLREEQKTPVLEISHPLDFDAITAKFIRLKDRFAPFGPGNLEPVFAAESVMVRDVRILKEAHVRFRLEQKGRIFEAIGFGLAEKWNKINQDRLHVAYQPAFKTWQDKTYIQLNLKDIKPV